MKVNNTYPGTITKYFTKQGWQVLDFQLEVLQKVKSGKSGLLNAPTGSGKTLALWAAFLSKYLDSQPKSNGLKLIWLTPLRSLTSDIVTELQAHAKGIGVELQIESRTGDTNSHRKTKQIENPPEVLVTTPESLQIMIATQKMSPALDKLQMIIVDEWHELLGNKRGVLLQLGLSYLRFRNTRLLTWGISATIGNTNAANQALNGEGVGSSIVIANLKHNIDIHTVFPENIEKYNWAGHTGTGLVDDLAQLIKTHKTTIIFTNTRSQTEIWYQKLTNAMPELAKKIGLHHGSIDKHERLMTENKLKNNELRAVVSTSSLDLGLDFRNVDNIVQIGSPKGITRLMQRAGRSNHRPGQPSTIHIIPTYTLDLLEIAALKHTFAQNVFEDKVIPENSLDVLTQFLITLAAGPGLDIERAWTIVQKSYSYRNLDKQSFLEILEFIKTGGNSLKAYDSYQKLIKKDGKYYLKNRYLLRDHKMNIGTITSNLDVMLKFKNGQKLGTIEEGYLANLNEKDNFWFAGQCLRLVRVSGDEALVKKSSGKKGKPVRWLGAKMELSSLVSESILALLSSWEDSDISEVQKLQPLLELQNSISRLPTKTVLPIELIETNEGHNLFCFTLSGRSINFALAHLISYRLGQTTRASYSVTANDFGFHILCNQKLDLASSTFTNLISRQNLKQDLLASTNISMLKQSKFRHIAQVAGLISQGYPGEKKAKHLQISGNLLYEVFSRYEPDNYLYKQALREVLESELNYKKLRVELSRLMNRKIQISYPERLTPFGFSLYAEAFRDQLSTENINQKLAQLIETSPLEARG